MIYNLFLKDLSILFFQQKKVSLPNLTFSRVERIFNKEIFCHKISRWKCFFPLDDRKNIWITTSSAQSKFQWILKKTGRERISKSFDIKEKGGRYDIRIEILLNFWSNKIFDDKTQFCRQEICGKRIKYTKLKKVLISSLNQPENSRGKKVMRNSEIVHQFQF